ncbi:MULTISPECIES: prepilin-type N-terminal cleavage/methylation domain-containing protein [Saccharibacillus]|uniref:prepilin-type N-terminal cleavage/methylation domain-containing protein n=1 Tax=Saccharibacillus TaxID=456492 RepID=UPI001F18A5E1|nr:prepilin-type N-terminal cleavage/methylation domain-containing protein [Saccharibacillus sp. WB 17]
MNQAGAVKEVEVQETGKSTFMQRVWSKMGKEEKGFTLIELLAVLVIIAIIAVIAIPLISGIINNSKDDADVATARQVYDASRLYVTGEKGGDFTKVTTIEVISPKAGDESLQSKKYVDDPLRLPSNKEIVTAGTVTYASGKLTGVTLTAGTTKRSYTADQVLKGTDR